MKVRIHTNVLIFLAVVASCAAAYFFPGVENNEILHNSITFLGILFGIIVGFFISDLFSRYQGLRENSAHDASALSTMYWLAMSLSDSKLNRKVKEDMKEAILSYVHTYMPLPWDSYAETERDYEAIGEVLRAMEYKTDKDGRIFIAMLNNYTAHSDVREKLMIYGRDKLSLGEWVIALLLGVTLLISLYYIKDTSVVSIGFTAAISSAILCLFIVLKDLDDLNYGQINVSNRAYERVLSALGEDSTPVERL